MTPLLTSDAVADLMADSVPQGDIAWRSEKIRRGIALTFPNVDDSTVPDEELVAATIREKISWASGESDTESIRDFDSGTSRTRWHLRDPYPYRHDDCVDSTEEDPKKYRRLMKPIVLGQKLDWEPVYPDEGDGYNAQPSFALSAQMMTDETGRYVGAHPAVHTAGQDCQVQL